MPNSSECQPTAPDSRLLRILRVQDLELDGMREKPLWGGAHLLQLRRRRRREAEQRIIGDVSRLRLHDNLILIAACNNVHVLQHHLFQRSLTGAADSGPVQFNSTTGSILVVVSHTLSVIE